MPQCCSILLFILRTHLQFTICDSGMAKRKKIPRGHCLYVDLEWLGNWSNLHYNESEIIWGSHSPLALGSAGPAASLPFTNFWPFSTVWLTALLNKIHLVMLKFHNPPFPIMSSICVMISYRLLFHWSNFQSWLVCSWFGAKLWPYIFHSVKQPMNWKFLREKLRFEIKFIWTIPFPIAVNVVCDWP